MAQKTISTPEAENPTEEALVYEDNSASMFGPSIELSFMQTPIKLPGIGFVRLVGILGGTPAKAMLEVENQSRVFKEGDKVGVYVLSEIYENKVLLKKGK